MTPGTEPEANSIPHTIPHAIRRWHALVATRSTEGLDALLADEIVFESPALHKPQVGRTLAHSYLAAAMQVLCGEQFRYVNAWYGADSAVLEFETQVEGLKVEGIDILHWDAADRITRFKVMIRPLKALNTVVAAMANTMGIERPATLTAPADPTRPLTGLKVVEFCQIASGPFGGMLLADFGADVIKVEPPAGDAMRTWPPLSNGFSENFASINRGKRSIALDLKDPADRDLARALVLEADVLLENSRPGAMQRLGLGWDWFSERKPSLVYCSISAFGQDGPRGAEGGFDVTVQAMAGVMSVTGEPDGAPVKAGVPLADFAAGLYAAYAIAAVIARVRAGGTGAQIDVPMFATTLAVSALQTSEYFGTGRDPVKLGSAHPRNAPYQAYRSKDDFFVIAAGNNKLWGQVCEIVGMPTLRDDPRFTSPTQRAQHQVALRELLEARFIECDAGDWLARFAAAGVPCAPINRYSQALDDPQTAHLDLVRPMALPGGTRTRTVGSPIRFDSQAVAIDTRVPALGADGESIRAAHDIKVSRS